VNGFSLIEALIALAVLSIGLLGLAALQIESLRANRAAWHRTQAVELSADLAERIGSHRAACAGKANCSAAQVASDDLTQWSAAIQSALPGGQSVATGTALPRGAVSIDAGQTPTRYAIEIHWQDPSDTVPASWTLAVQP
jgi:prepilin-type N-terminal cleavage/methylation domain-containing protein